MKERLMNGRLDCINALNSLYLEVDASIADNVKQKVLVAIIEEGNEMIDEIIDIIQNMEWGVMDNSINGKELLKKLNELKQQAKVNDP